MKPPRCIQLIRDGIQKDFVKSSATENGLVFRRETENRCLRSRRDGKLVYQSVTEIPPKGKCRRGWRQGVSLTAEASANHHGCLAEFTADPEPSSYLIDVDQVWQHS